jgi:glycosyltransferase involved in cell wall biosynthesis
MKAASYVLVTPVRNEEGTIGITIEAVVKQTVLPTEWVIVSDGSTDRTDEIVRTYAAKHPFLRLLRLDRRPSRNFASVVFATEAGLAKLQTTDSEFIGLLDGDIQFAENYYAEIMQRFAQDAKLGLAGGLVVDCIQGQRRRSVQSLGDVAGAVQFFRRECFAALGGLIALPEGGWDTITCVEARRHGYRTRTFPDIEVDHLKPRNVAEGGWLRRLRQMGVREYALGYHPLFEVLKCGYRCFEYPFLIGGIMRLAGYFSGCLSRRKRLLAPELVRFIRREQLRRIFPFGRSDPAGSQT